MMETTTRRPSRPRTVRRSFGVVLFCLLTWILAGCSSPPSAPLMVEGAVTGTGRGAREEQGGGSAGPLALTASPVGYSVTGDRLGEAPVPPVTGTAFVVVNPRSGEILAQRNPHLQVPVASTQKLLTALVILDGGGLNETVTVAGSDTWTEPTVMGIQAGERYRRGDLLQAMVVRSSNDIAKCLARTHSGSEAAFAGALNAKARELGMRNTRFVNAHGLTEPGSYSTAYDLSLLAQAAMRNSHLHRLTQIREMDFHFSDGRVKHIWNTNRVLFMSPYCSGLKTGYTAAAGRCLVSCAEKGGRRVITVVLGSKQPDIWTDSMKLLHWGLGIPGPA